MDDPLTIVHRYLDAIVAKDFYALNLADDFFHQSPFGRVDGVPAFIEACKLVVAHTKAIDIKRELVQGDTVCVFYDAVTATGRMPMTEWYRIRNGQIADIEVFFDASVRHP